MYENLKSKVDNNAGFSKRVTYSRVQGEVGAHIAQEIILFYSTNIVLYTALIAPIILIVS